MERAVTLAIRDALDAARARGGRLARITLLGGDDVSALARQVLSDLGRQEIEVDTMPGEGPPRLQSIEVVPRT